MKKMINESAIYDDPTRKKLSQYDVINTFSEVYHLLATGINKLETLTNSLIVDKKIREELYDSAIKISNELKLVLQYGDDYFTNLKIKDPDAIDKRIHNFNDQSQNINLNETTYDKINNTIKRIIDVNKKLNNGTKKK